MFVCTPKRVFSALSVSLSWCDFSNHLDFFKKEYYEVLSEQITNIKISRHYRSGYPRGDCPCLGFVKLDPKFLEFIVLVTICL